VAVAAYVGGMGRRAFEGLLAGAAAAERPDVLPEGYEPEGEPVRRVRSAAAGAVRAVDGRGLVRFAHAHGCRLVLRHTVGDFVTEGAVLAEVYGDDPGAAAEQRLRGMFALGVERTIEQDPAFAVRIMVDESPSMPSSRGWTRPSKPGSGTPSTSIWPPAETGKGSEAGPQPPRAGRSSRSSASPTS
jgi:hypothetical protein